MSSVLRRYSSRNEKNCLHTWAVLSLNHISPKTKLIPPARSVFVYKFISISYSPGDCIHGIFTPGCSFFFVLSARMGSSWDELIPPRNHITATRKLRTNGHVRRSICLCLLAVGFETERGNLATGWL